MALTEAPLAFREEFQGGLKTGLRMLENAEVLDFVGLEDGTESDVYCHDRFCTEQADLCVFICDYPSTGLGMEIAFRLASGKPMLCFKRYKAHITRMVTGMCAIEGVPILTYHIPQDITAKVRKELQRIREEKSA